MTSEFILAHGEEFIQCPYNTAHQITNARLITHLAKCRSDYLKSLTLTGQKNILRICRHNSTHHYPAPEIRFHEERCRDAFSVLRHVAYHNADEGDRYYEDRRKQDAQFEFALSSKKHKDSMDKDRTGRGDRRKHRSVPEEGFEMVGSGGRRKQSGRTGEEDWESVSSDSSGGQRNYREKDRAVEGDWKTAGGGGRSKHRERNRDGFRETASSGDNYRERDGAVQENWEAAGGGGRDKYRNKYPENDKHAAGGLSYRDQYRDRRPSVVDDLQPENNPVANPNEWGIEEEDWEAECSGSAPGYNPQVKLKTEFVVYNPQGLTKSERKKFRNEVREKIAEREMNGEPVEFPTPSTLEMEVKPDIKNLTLNPKIKKEPVEREPGELSTDDDDDNLDGAGCNQAGPSHPSGGFNESNNAAASTSYNYPKSNTTRISFDKLSDEEPDSDDFAGDDPYSS